MLTRIPEQWLSRAILVDVSLALTGLALCLLLPNPFWRLVSSFAALACCLDALLAVYLLDHQEK
ncbi:MAG: hypothetical protein F4Z75_03750 [Synechococcus sp. SB0668_bin_15]|nr:hypothetical protein [Synechococcus sp. SB0668_bin_15]MXZ83579.1 hypothetical protein [Synechococcus sp. SB0666_bin_14]MYA91160.1 hypothetical protein [Synechococcus sp. SB0663_bin_10]MYC48846.1 hypothetical protein [Synechococcus sp. SB0662_bin_14]MYG46851.1 hypothetical protein [Synechococcus sp. SB0675_bin_6]MYJ59448.1 hypothetical protein [Synechococcus sp. SB0672_bin_6]MYK91542.1 hypothetical protein [Synechococcus sp. SB0669_bin_8]